MWSDAMDVERSDIPTNVGAVDAMDAVDAVDAVPDRNAAHIVIDRQNRLWYSKWKSLGQPVAGVLDLNGDSLVSVIDLAGGKLAVEEIYSVHHLEPYRREMLIITKSGILYNYSTTGWEQICRWPTPVQGAFAALKTRDGNYWVCNGQKAFQVKRGQIREVSYLLAIRPL